jgi:hypothetical protein
MQLSFYLYGAATQGIEDISAGSFSFAVEEHATIAYPACLIWVYPDTDNEALLCKIRRTRKPADRGMVVYVCDAIKIQVVAHGLFNSISPLARSIPGRDLRDSLLWSHGILPVPDDKVDLVKTIILKHNPGILDESYFLFQETPPVTDVLFEADDAFHTALRIFGVKPEDIPPLREHQILDFDVASIFADAFKLGTTPDGKHFFEYNKRRLYLHKVDRTPIERYLGVDLIYNFLQEKRLVFVQYKCQKPRGKYHPSSDSSHDAEIQRMEAIPGLGSCPNLAVPDERSARLCHCPVFIKLCKRELSESHAVPVGVYYPLCIWQCIIRRHQGVSIRNEPHLNNVHFQELVRNGLIGSTASQAQDIEEHLIREANDDRLKLVFEEAQA